MVFTKFSGASFITLMPHAQFSIITDMENSTFSGHFREKSTRKSCVNFILSFWNPLYYLVKVSTKGSKILDKLI